MAPAAPDGAPWRPELAPPRGRGRWKPLGNKWTLPGRGRKGDAIARRKETRRWEEPPGRATGRVGSMAAGEERNGVFLKVATEVPLPDTVKSASGRAPLEDAGHSRWRGPRKPPHRTPAAGGPGSSPRLGRARPGTRR